MRCCNETACTSTDPRDASAPNTDVSPRITAYIEGEDSVLSVKRYVEYLGVRERTRVVAGASVHVRVRFEADHACLRIAHSERLDGRTYVAPSVDDRARSGCHGDIPQVPQKHFVEDLQLSEAADAKRRLATPAIRHADREHRLPPGRQALGNRERYRHEQNVHPASEAAGEASETRRSADIDEWARHPELAKRASVNAV